MSQSEDNNVQFGGKCSFALSLGKTDVEGNKSVFMVKDGKKYFFLNPVAKFLFKILPGTTEKAQATFDSIK